VTMKKHPESFKLESPLKELNDKVTAETVLYDGPVRGLCPLAPNNVNTMAAAAIAAECLGFDGVQGSIVSDPNLIDSHIVEIQVTGMNGFHVKTVRTNPAKIGNVTGQATYASFWASLLRSGGKRGGLFLC